MDRDHGRRLEAGAAAVLSADYQQAVQLLLRLVPAVFATEAFAGHNRPPHEILAGRDKPREAST